MQRKKTTYSNGKFNTTTTKKPTKKRVIYSVQYE